jgi:dihydroxy-acid dehydratase
VAPEAAHGGPIAALHEGDVVRFDIPARTLSVDLSDEEIAARLGALAPVPPRIASGVMGKYARLVSSAAKGAITV